MFHSAFVRLGRLAATGVLVAAIGGAQGAVRISPTTLPDWTTGAPYSQNLTAGGCGGGCVWNFTGTLPTGLLQSATTGAISGIPLVAGSFSFTVIATAEQGSQGSQAYTVVIHAPPAINTSSLPNGTAGQAYSQTLAVSDGTPPYRFAVNSGALPAGLRLDASSGTISGTPNRTGAANFTIAVTDHAGVVVTQGYTLTVTGANLTVTTGSPLPAGTVGATYSQMLAVSGAAGPVTWSLATGTLPAGLGLTATSGLISGTPTAAGSFTFTVEVADGNGARATKDFSIAIAPAAQTLSITSNSPLPDAAVGTAYAQTLAATGGAPPYTWSIAAGNLPAGLSLDASSGSVSGTPTAAGTFVFTAQVTDHSHATATQALSITVNASNLTITSTALPSATVGVGYAQTLTATGGLAPYSWTVIAGTLPAGLVLAAATGAISGTPTAAGTSTFTVQAQDSASAKASQQFSITVAAPSGGSPLSITGIPSTAASAQQIPFDVTLSSPSARTVTGHVTLSFQPTASVNKDDPAVQFSTGGRTVNFTIPAGSTRATFGASTLALQTGTVAGTIQLAVSSDLSNGTASSSVVVGETAPVIQSATITKNASGFNLQIAGYSNSLELAGATFRFTAQSGQTLQTGDLTSDLSKLAAQWYGGGTSSSFGGQFLILVPFTVEQGAVSGLTSVSVQLQNGRGASAVVSANF